MDEYNVCPICFDTFTYPKILQCGHTFCFQCLKDFVDDKSTRKNFLCPLCRAKWKIPKSGLSVLPTNYFVGVSKLKQHEKYCLHCYKIGESFSCCSTCGSYFCIKCFGAHFHLKEPEEVLDEDDGTQEFRLLNIFSSCQKLKTQIECRLQTHFVVEIPADNKGFHNIYTISLSKSGELYVIPSGLHFILKYDEFGRQINKIRTPFQCTGIVERKTNICLLGAFLYDQIILKYEHGEWSNFASCPAFLPFDIIELSNENIIACGPSSSLLQSESNTSLKPRGYLQLYSKHRNPLKRLDKLIGDETLLHMPHKMAYNKEKRIIAVADQESNSVIILDEISGSCRIYKGHCTTLISLPLLGIQQETKFHIAGICRGPCNYFIAATPEGCLNFIDENGHLRGLGITDAEDCFGRLNPNVAIDNINGTIWCSDSQYGTVKTFKIVKYTNKLDSS